MRLDIHGVFGIDGAQLTETFAELAPAAVPASPVAPEAEKSAEGETATSPPPPAHEGEKKDEVRKLFLPVLLGLPNNLLFFVHLPLPSSNFFPLGTQEED